MPIPPQESQNAPQDNSKDLLNEAYLKAVEKIGLVHKATGKALDQMRKTISSQYDALKALKESFERMAHARKAIDGALKDLASPAYKSILEKKGIVLQPTDFYLGLVRKESNYDQQAESNSDGSKKDADGNMLKARGLFQILVKIDPEGNESSQTVNDLNSFYGLAGKVSDIYYRGSDQGARDVAAQNNALMGVLYWHRCRDVFVNRLQPQWSNEDKDKLGNMIYNMGPGNVENLMKALNNPKNFKEFGVKLSAKLHELYPDDLDNKEDVLLDPEIGLPYNTYFKTSKGFDPKNKDVQIGESTFKLSKIFESLKYAELVFSLNHPRPKESASAEYSVIGENGKWYWGIVKDLSINKGLDPKPNGEKMKVLMGLIFTYNKSIKNPDFADTDGIDDLKKGSKVYFPPLQDLQKSLASAPTPTSAPMDKKPAPSKLPEQYTKVGPLHILKDKGLMILDSLIPSIYLIDTSGIDKAVELKQLVSRSTDEKNGKKFEHDQIQIKIGNLTGFFQLEGHGNISYGPLPLDKGGIWDSYDIHLDNEKNVIKILPQLKSSDKPKTTPPEKHELPKKPKDYLDPDQPLDLSWPNGVERHIPKKGEAIYIGRDGKALATEGAKLHQPSAVPEPKYDTPDWLNPDKGVGKGWERMDSVDGIVLHATEGTVGKGSKLFREQNTHFVVKRNSEIWQVRNPEYYTNHTGYFDSDYGAIWDGDKTPAESRIGIEVETYAFEEMLSKGLISFPVHPDKDGELNIGTAYDKNGDLFHYTTNDPVQSDLNKAWEQAGKNRSYNEAEYKSLNELVKYLAYKNQIKKQNIITHSMLGSGENGRGRKTDPCNLDFSKLGLPDNYRRVDPDVARGTLPSQIVRVEGERKGTYLDRARVNGRLVYKVYKKGDEYHYLPSSGFGGQSFMNSGLKAAQGLCEDMGKCAEAKDPAEVKIDAQSYDMDEAELNSRLQQSRFMADQGFAMIEYEGQIKIDSNMTAYEAIKRNVGKDCPADVINNLSLVDVLYYSFDNQVHKGQIVVHKKLAEDVQEIFALAYKLKFPISKVVPISDDRYNWNDDKSVMDNNTSSFNYRNIANSDSVSDHAFGFAIDINPFLNPYTDKKGTPSPSNASYNPNLPGALSADHPLVKKFISLGWKWGGNWKGAKDYQHFSKKP